MQIGITEQGDAGIDLTWVDKVKSNQVDGCILITKNITSKFIDNVINLHKLNKKLIAHCTCTGWGKTILEPNVPGYLDQLFNLNNLIAAGFPKERCILRIDPIIPTEEGILRANKVLNQAKLMEFIPDMRVRISILDEYQHTKKRFMELNIPTIYEGNRFQANNKEMQRVIKLIKMNADVHFECCAEPKLNSELKERKIFNLESSGCVNWEDINRMDIDVSDRESDKMQYNLQNRAGCLCLSCKTELLNRRTQCPNKCVYCYWTN